LFFGTVVSFNVEGTRKRLGPLDDVVCACPEAATYTAEPIL